MRKMNWHDPTDKSRPIISPQAQIAGFLRNRANLERFRVHERFLMDQTGCDAALEGQLPVQKEPFPIPAFLGNRTLYVIETEPRISLVEKALAAPIAVDVLEVAVAMGARKLFFLGLCGAIADNLEIGDMVMPLDVEREEGTSYHYVPADARVRPDMNLAGRLADFLSRRREPRVCQGRTVTTDAVFRQTLNKERRWRDNGILGVDMETSALLAAAQFYGLPAVCLLVVSDKHVLEEESQWHWGGTTLKESHANAVRLFTQFITTT